MRPISKREWLLDHAMALALAGCNAPECMRPELCKACSLELIRTLVQAARGRRAS